MLRPISADEYDAVLRLQPALCPLAAAGDARPGARLLADAVADAAAGGLAAALRREDGQGGGGEGGLRFWTYGFQVLARVVCKRERVRACPCARAPREIRLAAICGGSGRTGSRWCSRPYCVCVCARARVRARVRLAYSVWLQSQAGTFG